MATIVVHVSRQVEQTKAVYLKVSKTAVKQWLRDNHGTPSEHGYEWDDEVVLQEYVEAEFMDQVNDDNTCINEEDEDWDIDEVGVDE